MAASGEFSIVCGGVVKSAGGRWPVAHASNIINGITGGSRPSWKSSREIPIQKREHQETYQETYQETSGKLSARLNSGNSQLLFDLPHIMNK